MKKTIYLLSSKMSWKTFQLLQKKLVKDSGPAPKNGDRMLWELLRDKRIYCWFGEEWKSDMGVGVKIPKNYKVKIIK